jgi:hypothetical protein
MMHPSEGTGGVQETGGSEMAEKKIQPKAPEKAEPAAGAREATKRDNLQKKRGLQRKRGLSRRGRPGV